MYIRIVLETYGDKTGNDEKLDLENISEKGNRYFRANHQR